jgi:hypothetical protein
MSGFRGFTEFGRKMEQRALAVWLRSSRVRPADDEPEQELLDHTAVFGRFWAYGSPSTGKETKDPRFDWDELSVQKARERRVVWTN